MTTEKAALDEIKAECRLAADLSDEKFARRLLVAIEALEETASISSPPIQRNKARKALQQIIAIK